MRITFILSILFSTLIFLGSCNLAFAESSEIGLSRIHPATPLYFLKTVRESIEMHFARTPKVKRIRQLEFATRRLREVKALISVNREDLIESTLERYWSAINSLPDKALEDKEIASLIGGTISSHMSALEQIYGQIKNPKAKMALRAIVNKFAGRADLFSQTRSSVCSFLSKEASSSALNQTEQQVLKERAVRCGALNHF